MRLRFRAFAICLTLANLSVEGLVRIIVLSTALAVICSTVIAQTVSDEALTECQSDNARFTSIKDCLPGTHVALAMLAAVQTPELYGSSGEALVAACSEKNETSVSKWACAENAISDAVELLEMVGSADKISDPLFQGLSSPETYQQLQALEDREQSGFDIMMWGGTMYHPLK